MVLLVVFHGGLIRDFGSETKRINISVSADFLDKADAYAKKNHLSRSALLQTATMEYIASWYFFEQTLSVYTLQYKI